MGPKVSILGKLQGKCYQLCLGILRLPGVRMGPFLSCDSVPKIGPGSCTRQTEKVCMHI